MPGFLKADATYRTRRRQLVVAAATGTFALILAASVLLGDGRRVAYRSTTPPRQPATGIKPGESMCRAGVLIPAQSVAVRLNGALSPGIKGPPLRLTATTPKGRYTSDGTWTADSVITFPLPRPAESSVGRICVKNRGSQPTGFMGLAYNSSAGSQLTVEGKLQRGDIAVEVNAPRSSLLSIVPTIFRRATIWAPRWVGAWTFYLLFAFGLAAVALAVWLVMVSGRRARAKWVIAGLAVVNGLAWSILTPPWQAPDEIAHFAYVQHFAETGQPSVDEHPKIARDYSTEHQYAMEWGQTNTVRANPAGKPPWDPRARKLLEDQEKRLHAAKDDGTRAALNYTPAYYGIDVLGYLAFDWGDIFDRLGGARLISALLGGLTAIWVWLFARELFRREDWLTNTAALAAVLLPQFGFISGAVNNDNLVIMLGSLELYLLARALRRGLDARLSVLIGVVLALGYLAKPSMAAFGPLVAGVLAWPLIRDRDRRRLLYPVAGVAGFALVGLIWSGIAASSGRTVSTVTTSTAQTFSVQDFASYIRHFYLPSLSGTPNRWFGTQVPLYSVWMHSFFAAFGSNDTLFHESVYRVIRDACAVVAVLIGIAAWRERKAVRRALPVVLMSVVAAVSLIAFIHLTFYLYYNGYPGEQGRYLLPLAPLFGAAIAASTLALGRRHAPLLATFYVTALGCFTLFSYGLVLTRYYT